MDIKNYLKSYYVIFLIVSFSCSHSPIISGSQNIVERSHSAKPEWVTDIPGETDVFIYSVGTRTQSPTLEGGETDARMEGARKILERFFGLKTTIEYTKIRRTFETDYLDKIKATGGGEIFGTKTKSVYWEKYENFTENRMLYNYNVWVLLEVRKSDIEKALEKMAKRRDESIKAAKAGMENISKKSGIDALKEISDYEKMLSEFENDPEVKPVLIEIEQRKREIEAKEKSIAVLIEEKNLGEIESGFVRNMIYDVLKKYSFHIQDVNKNQEKFPAIIDRPAAAYILTVEVQTKSSNELSGHFVFAYAQGRMTLLNTSSKKTLLSYNINEKGAGNDMRRAGTAALKIAAKTLSKKLDEAIKEIW
ncbi:MAG TPA: hypothetical protein VII00_05910 [bacterium]